MNKKVIAFGGTGKIVALIYMKIARLLGETPSVVVVDFPHGVDTNREDDQLDQDLRAEGLDEQSRLSTLPDHITTLPRNLVEAFNLPREVADALFTEHQQRTPPVEGLNQEPQVGATVAQLKIASDGDKLRSRIETGHSEAFYVAGLGGGTGTGVTPAFAQFLKSNRMRSHGVLLLPWRDIGDSGKVNNAQQQRNAASLLAYMRDNHGKLFHDWVVLGSSDRFSAQPNGANPAGANKPVHPTLILAALYIHLWHKWGGGHQLSAQALRIETAATGIRLQDIAGQDGRNLYDMLKLSHRMERVLHQVASQSPDQRLAWFNLYPLSAPLAWDSIEWLVKLYRIHTNRISYAQAWNDIRTRLVQIAENETARRQWITTLASDRRLFDFDPNQLEADAQARYSSLLHEIKQADEYTTFRFAPNDDAETALSKVCSAVYNMAFQRLRGK